MKCGLDLSELLVYLLYNVMEPNLEHLDLHYMVLYDFLFFLSFQTKYLIKNLSILTDCFDISNLVENHKISLGVNKKVPGKFEIQNLKSLRMDSIFYQERILLVSLFKQQRKRNKIETNLKKLLEMKLDLKLTTEVYWSKLKI